MREASERVRLTGCGVVTAAGALRGELWRHLIERRSGIRPARFLEESGLAVRFAGEVDPAQLDAGFDPPTHCRSTVFAAQAVADAIADADLARAGLEPEEIGIALGTNFANLEACVSFCETSLAEGWRALRPTLFPGTMITTPAGQLAIRFGLRGPNATLSTGHGAGVDALEFAIGQVACGRARAMIVVGVEELSREVVAGFAEAGLLAGGGPGGVGEARCAPYDARAAGIILGEGAAALVIEDRASALRRGARRLARIRSVATARSPAAHACFGGGDPGPLARAMEAALRAAELRPDEIDCISGSADSGVVDALEGEAVRAVFPHPPPVTAVKGNTGECLAASPMIQLGLAAVCLREGIIPPVCGLEQPSPRVGLRSIVREPTAAPLGNVLVSAVGWDGAASALIVGGDSERSLAP